MSFLIEVRPSKPPKVFPSNWTDITIDESSFVFTTEMDTLPAAEIEAKNIIDSLSENDIYIEVRIYYAENTRAISTLVSRITYTNYNKGIEGTIELWMHKTHIGRFSRLTGPSIERYSDTGQLFERSWHIDGLVVPGFGGLLDGTQDAAEYIAEQPICLDVVKCLHYHGIITLPETLKENITAAMTLLSL